MLKRIYPHDETYIYDNSIYTMVTDPNGDGTSFLQVILADKGRDNQLLTFNDLGAFIKEFGFGNFKSHGQSYYNAYNILQNGGTCHVMRITAKNATYSNILILAKVKTISDVPKTDDLGNPLYLTADGEETTIAENNTAIVRDVNEVKLISKTISNLNSLDTLESLLANEYNADADTDGYKTFPLFSIIATGRGAFGDKLHFRITPNPMADKERVYRNYNLESYINDGGLVKLEDTYNVSLYNEAKTNGLVEYVEELVTEMSVNYRVFMSESHYDLLIEEFQKTIPDIREQDLDILFGLDTDGTEHYQIKMATDGLDLSKLEGVSLSSGSDGDFSIKTIDRQDKIDERLVEAYSGVIDDSVFNVWSYPVDVLLDANYAISVKNTIVSLGLKREDCITIIDAGTQPTGNAALAWRREQFNYDTWRVMLYTESGKVTDPFTGKSIHVTDTYKLSKFIPIHDNSKGFHIPIAGLDYGKISEYKKGTMLPLINVDKMQDKLYEDRINFTDKFKDKYYMNMEVTAQYANSDLSLYHNIRILLALKRRLELFAKYKRYKFTEPEDIQKYIQEANEIIIKEFQDKMLSSAELRLEQTDYEKRANILRWVLDIKFKNIILYNIIELNIN